MLANRHPLHSRRRGHGSVMLARNVSQAEDVIAMIGADILIDTVRPGTLTGWFPTYHVAVPTVEDRPTSTHPRLVRMAAPENWLGLYVAGELVWEGPMPSPDELARILHEHTDPLD